MRRPERPGRSAVRGPSGPGRTPRVHRQRRPRGTAPTVSEVVRAPPVTLLGIMSSGGVSPVGGVTSTALVVRTHGRRAPGRHARLPRGDGDGQARSQGRAGRRRAAASRGCGAARCLRRRRSAARGRRCWIASFRPLRVRLGRDMSENALSRTLGLPLNPAAAAAERQAVGFSGPVLGPNADPLHYASGCSTVECSTRGSSSEGADFGGACFHELPVVWFGWLPPAKKTSAPGGIRPKALMLRTRRSTPPRWSPRAAPSRRSGRTAPRQRGWSAAELNRAPWSSPHPGIRCLHARC